MYLLLLEVGSYPVTDICVSKERYVIPMITVGLLKIHVVLYFVFC